jgi:hypothetical protein
LSSSNSAPPRRSERCPELGKSASAPTGRLDGGAARSDRSVTACQQSRSHFRVPSFGSSVSNCMIRTAWP